MKLAKCSVAGSAKPQSNAPRTKRREAEINCEDQRRVVTIPIIVQVVVAPVPLRTIPVEVQRIATTVRVADYVRIVRSTTHRTNSLGWICFRDRNHLILTPSNFIFAFNPFSELNMKCLHISLYLKQCFATVANVPIEILSIYGYWFRAITTLVVI